MAMKASTFLFERPYTTCGGHFLYLPSLLFFLHTHHGFFVASFNPDLKAKILFGLRWGPKKGLLHISRKYFIFLWVIHTAAVAAIAIILIQQRRIHTLHTKATFAYMVSNDLVR